MRTRDTNTGVGRTLVACTLAGAALAVLPACRGDRSEKPPRQFFPDLDDQPRWKPQGQTEFFADGRMMRLPPTGTVAFGSVSFVSGAPWADWATRERADLLKHDSRFYEGKETDGTFVERIPSSVEVTRAGGETTTVPFAVNDALIERGRERYNIYCVVCHGYAGDGRGMVGQQWSAPLPNYNDPKYKFPDKNDPKIQQWKDGYLFNVARNGFYDVQGVQKMPSYGHALDERDTWAVVAYIRTLQEAHSGSMQDVPAADRAALERQMTSMREAALAEEARAAAEKAKASPTTPASGAKQ